MMSVVILAIISAVGYVYFHDSDAHLRTEAAATLLATDLRYAQNLATTQGQDIILTVNPAQNQYSATWANGDPVIAPTSSQPLGVKFGEKNFVGVQLASTGLQDNQIRFTTTGMAQMNGSVFTGTVEVARFSDGIVVQISGGTGFVEIIH